MLVRATDKYEKLNLKDKELCRMPKEGEQFEVTEERYEVLTKTNRYNTEFVEAVIIEDKVETKEDIIDEKGIKANDVIDVVAKEVAIKPKKNTRKKK